jgi:hypothetical protein
MIGAPPPHPKPIAAGHSVLRVARRQAVCLQHFRGNLDFWDPVLVDRIAQDREVVLLANRGVGSSTGVVLDNVTDMARDDGSA